MAYLRAQTGRKRKPVKELLHDQSVVADIGNIYSDKILFDARVNPQKPCCALDDEEWERLRLTKVGGRDSCFCPECQSREYTSSEQTKIRLSATSIRRA